MYVLCGWPWGEHLEVEKENGKCEDNWEEESQDDGEEEQVDINEGQNQDNKDAKTVVNH